MVSEALNHIQYNESHSPKKDEIPQAVVFIYDYIANECTDESFAELNTEYLDLLKANNELCDVYLKCFSKGESRGREKERSDKEKPHRKKDK